MLLCVCTQVILLDITLELQKQIMSELEILYKVIPFSVTFIYKLCMCQLPVTNHFCLIFLAV